MAHRITIKDIAKESGYSIGTVSRTLNNLPGVSAEARKAIQEVVSKYNFQLNPNARSLKHQSRPEILIMIRGQSNLLFAQILEIITLKVEEKGYDAMIYYLDEDENEVREVMKVTLIRSCQGILFLGSSRKNFRELFGNIHVPSLMVTNSALGLPFTNLSSVSTDDAKGARAAIEYLFELGHEQIGIIGGDLENSQAARTRIDGVRAAYKEKKIPFLADLQYEAERFSVDGGYKAMERLLKKNPDMSAVFVMSDIMAIGAMRAAADHGFNIPKDISFIGFDGLKLSDYAIPRLTTIVQDIQNIARRSVDILIETIEGRCVPVYEELPFSLQIKESTCSRKLQSRKARPESDMYSV